MGFFTPKNEGTVGSHGGPRYFHDDLPVGSTSRPFLEFPRDVGVEQTLKAGPVQDLRFYTHQARILENTKQIARFFAPPTKTGGKSHAHVNLGNFLS